MSDKSKIEVSAERTTSTTKKNARIIAEEIMDVTKGKSWSELRSDGWHFCASAPVLASAYLDLLEFIEGQKK